MNIIKNFDGRSFVGKRTFVQKCRDNIALFDGCFIHIGDEVFTFIDVGASNMTATIRILIGFFVQIFVNIQQKLWCRFSD